jgi:Bacterial regulatory protein, Fis family
MPSEQQLRNYFSAHRVLPLHHVRGFILPRRVLVRPRLGTRAYVLEYNVGAGRPPDDVPPVQWIPKEQPPLEDVGGDEQRSSRYVIAAEASLDDSIRDLLGIAEARLLAGPARPPVSRDQLEEMKRERARRDEVFGFTGRGEPDREQITAALTRESGNVQKAAVALGIAVTVLAGLAQRYGIRLRER